MSNISNQVEEVNKFYQMKNEYESKYQAKVSKIMSSDLSVEEKREQVARIERRCIECNKVGGTVFEANRDVLAVRCNAQDGQTRCPLDMVIEKGAPVEDGHVILLRLKSDLEKAKSVTIETKMKHALGMLDEAEVVSRFDFLKNAIEDMTKAILVVEEKMLSVTNNIEKQRDTDRLRIKIYELVEEFKGLLGTYKREGRESYMRDAIASYIRQIEPAATELRQNKFTVNRTFVNDEGDIILVQEPYTLEQTQMAIPNVLL